MDKMDPRERDLLRRYLGGYRVYAEVNGRAREVLYSSRFYGDLLPWIAVDDPSLRFVNRDIHVHVVTCTACGADAGPGIRYRRNFPVMDLCEGCGVAELAGDLVQIEKGTMK
jgi:hypothetical protein